MGGTTSLVKALLLGVGTLEGGCMLKGHDTSSCANLWERPPIPGRTELGMNHCAIQVLKTSMQ